MPWKQSRRWGQPGGSGAGCFTRQLLRYPVRRGGLRRTCFTIFPLKSTLGSGQAEPALTEGSEKLYLLGQRWGSPPQRHPRRCRMCDGTRGGPDTSESISTRASPTPTPGQCKRCSPLHRIPLAPGRGWEQRLCTAPGEDQPFCRHLSFRSTPASEPEDLEMSCRGLTASSYN